MFPTTGSDLLDLDEHGVAVLMLSEEDDVDIHVLKRQGMTISEIVRRTGHDRETIRTYLSGNAPPGREHARLFGVVSDAESADPGPRIAAGMHALRTRHAAAERGDRASTWTGDPVRLGRDAVRREVVF